MTDTKKPEALRLADELVDTPFESTRYEAAAELRRLHDLLGKANALCRIREERIRELQAENEALRKALRKALRDWFSYANYLEMEGRHIDGEHSAMQQGRATMKEKP